MAIDYARVRNIALLVPAMIALNISMKHASPRDILADPPTLRATVTLTIGGASEERAAYEFGYISGLTFDAKGQTYVADAKEHNVRVFSDKGVHTFTIGRKGAGPLDFNVPTNISISKDGMLWVQDAQNHRFSVINPTPPAGKHVRTIPFLSNVGRPDRVHWNAAGQVAEITHATNTKVGEPRRTVRQFLDDRGNVVSIDTAPPESKDSVEQWVFRDKNSSATHSKPFGAQRLSAFGEGGFAAFATNTNYAVSLIDAQGKRIALLKRSVSAVALTAADNAIVTASLENIAKQRQVPASSLDFEKPKLKPAISQLRFDIDGRLWVERSVAEGKPREADVYARDGKWVAVMQWPAEVSLWLGANKGNTGLGTAADADGVQRVVRLQWK